MDVQRGLFRLLGVFGGTALALALTGLWGVVAYTVRSRTREIGVRLALGARPADVVRHFTMSRVRLALLGLAGGLPLAIGLSALISSSLIGVPAGDPPTFLAVTIVTAVIAVLGAYLPARQASRVEPVTALRHE